MGAGKTGFMGKVKRLFSFGNKDGTNAVEDPNELRLTRTVTGEHVFHLARTKTNDYPSRRRSVAAGAGAGGLQDATAPAQETATVTASEPPAMARSYSDSACPLPVYRGRPITALHVPGATSVLELKYQPYASGKQPAVVQLDIGTPKDRVRLAGFGRATDQREVTIKFTFGEAMFAK